MKNKIYVSVLLSLIVLSVSFALSLFLGAQKLCVSEMLTEGSVANNIFLNLRLPRSLLCLIAGAMLGGSGAVFQMFFRNSLAEPGILGLSAGATFGAVSFVCLVPAVGVAGLTLLNLGAFTGAILGGTIIVSLAFFSRHSLNSVLLLCGVSLGTLYSALTSIILSIDTERISSMYMWMLGSFSGRGWNEVLLIFPVAIVACILFIIAMGHLDLLCGGEEAAFALGLRLPVLRIQVLLAGALATTAAVCAGGTIGFVGLIAPHMVRKIYGTQAKVLVPLSMVMGAVVLLLSDTLCRCVLPPREIPVGTVTAILGVPFFLSLLLSKKRGTE